MFSQSKSDNINQPVKKYLFLYIIFFLFKLISANVVHNFKKRYEKNNIK